MAWLLVGTAGCEFLSSADDQAASFAFIGAPTTISSADPVMVVAQVRDEQDVPVNGIDVAFFVGPGLVLQSATPTATKLDENSHLDGVAKCSVSLDPNARGSDRLDVVAVVEDLAPQRIALQRAAKEFHIARTPTDGLVSTDLDHVVVQVTEETGTPIDGARIGLTAADGSPFDLTIDDLPSTSVVGTTGALEEGGIALSGSLRASITRHADAPAGRYPISVVAWIGDVSAASSFTVVVQAP